MFGPGNQVVAVIIAEGGSSALSALPVAPTLMTTGRFRFAAGTSRERAFHALAIHHAEDEMTGRSDTGTFGATGQLVTDIHLVAYGQPLRFGDGRVDLPELGKGDGTLTIPLRLARRVPRLPTATVVHNLNTPVVLLQAEYQQMLRLGVSE